MPLTPHPLKPHASGAPSTAPSRSPLTPTSCGWRPPSLFSTRQGSSPRAKHPNILLAYNLSPSFNRDAADLTDHNMEDYLKELGGKFRHPQTQAPFSLTHLPPLPPILYILLKTSLRHGMLAYVRGVLRQERLNDVETLQYQKWSGAHYYDELIKTISGGVASTAAMGKGTTEDQFKH
ncbi:LOW QUALITY PROTEIN: hypothetical protein BC938DRAFT_470591 [Jimgerdemannia flammicorona]|uniref:methylisocitrate lyase n=1 Tax=Jimgerdemannia flammicorona TaxID=994334 RepID=A0A433QA10_9FUNG|nr:LOW QUALITY PROTEIN: hypothetical protein BC938DRAFT_470591 [Jimgerdemannia flammicorona]